MISVLFVCHGNICRSPMAESVMTDLVKKAGSEASFVIASAATHCDEIGNPPHRGTVAELKRHGIPLVPHVARLMTEADGKRFDYLIAMDGANVRDMRRIAGAAYADKVMRLLDFTPHPREVADPWYTGDFSATYRDVSEGCRALLDFLICRGDITF